MRWLRQSRRHVETAAGWVLADGARFTGQTQTATPVQITRITQRDLLDVPAAPAIVRVPGEVPLKAQFDFLQGLGKLPEAATLARLQSAFAYDGLTQVMRQAQRYGLDRFEYVDHVAPAH